MPEARKLGASEMVVEPFCFGTMNLGSATPDDEALRMLDLALSEGVRFFDLADVAYAGRSEVLVGKALEHRGLRDEVVLSVEISGPDMGVPERPNLSRSYIRSAVELALGRLRCDYIDVYVIPRPSLDVPMSETLGVLAELIDEGLIRAVSTSTFPAWMVAEALWIAERENSARVIFDESPYNLLDRRIENELVPMAMKHGLGIVAWAPLAQGMLASTYTGRTLPTTSRAVRIGGKYRERITKEGIEFGRRFDALARYCGLSSAELAFCWARDQPGITAPTVGPRTVDQLRVILGAREVSLPDEIRTACDHLNPPGSVVTDFYNTAPWMKMRIDTARPTMPNRGVSDIYERKDGIQNDTLA
ncbi:MAG: aldo/keto reductase [Solirubrobacterales bacterium]